MLADGSEDEARLRNRRRTAPFYYYLWHADGTETLQRMPADCRRQRSSSGCSEPPIPRYEIPPATAPPPPPIDETHTPKKLTIATENLICRFSSTHLSKLQETIAAVESDPARFDFGAMGELSSSSDRPALSTDPLPNSSAGAGRPDALNESRVLVLYTGGTIGMRCRDGVYSPEQHYLPGAIRELPPLHDVDYADEHYGDTKVKPYCLPPVRGIKKRVVYWLVEYEPLLDSSDMTFDDWIRIARDIEKSYNAYDGFVVLHGTDTLAYTACALSFMMENLGKPVVITGAQVDLPLLTIPVAEVRSDGRENMIGALIVAGSLDVPEVCVLFNNKLMRGCRVTKMDNHGLDAFQSPNMAPIANLDISINVNYESIFRSPDVAPFHVHGNLCRNVIVLRIFPSMPIESVTASLKPPTRGVVLQTFGSGNMPSRRADIIAEIANAVQRGCLVLNVTQCFKGHVEVTYASGKILADAGVIAGSDLTTEAALAKLAYVLSKDEWDFQMKSEMLNRNLRGELTVMHSEHIDEMDLIPRLAKFLCITSSLETRLLRNALFPPLVCNAAHANDVELLEQLRRNGANIASADYNLRTALHVAAAAGSADAVDYLLRHGVSVHARDAFDDNALTCAVKSKNLRVVRAIRKAGGQLVVPLSRIGVELCLAANLADIQSLRAWREAGADFSTPDYDGRTALHVACNLGLYRVAKFLCDNGAAITARDRFGATPADDCRQVMSTIKALYRSVSSSPLLANYDGDEHSAESELIAPHSDDEADSLLPFDRDHKLIQPVFTLTTAQGEEADERSVSAQSVSGLLSAELSESSGRSTQLTEARRIYRRLQSITDLLQRHASNNFHRLAIARTTSDDSMKIAGERST